MVKKITTTELRQGKINGGIIFQGCAEPLDEWVTGVNDMLTEAGILLEGTKYKPEDVYSRHQASSLFLSADKRKDIINSIEFFCRCLML